MANGYTPPTLRSPSKLMRLSFITLFVPSAAQFNTAADSNNGSISRYLQDMSVPLSTCCCSLYSYSYIAPVRTPLIPLFPKPLQQFRYVSVTVESEEIRHVPNVNAVPPALVPPAATTARDT
ncbi:hypothetical protein E2C01_088026 [Portunus trituberculatus]|uniref:Uncharacterized protein n=1 Tax=Portunus trituberculatus TaxID=210409 RepID=A0A5B7JKW3_PORTR|nr:hypothetical protein [Portunus trituberculatus]